MTPPSDPYTEKLPLEEEVQRKNSDTPKRYFCDFSDNKVQIKYNSKENTSVYKVTSSQFVYVDHSEVSSGTEESFDDNQ